eukprot:3812659-Pleurochrysis_carterae.AAC.1
MPGSRASSDARATAYSAATSTHSSTAASAFIEDTAHDAGMLNVTTMIVALIFSSDVVFRLFAQQKLFFRHKWNLVDLALAGCFL